MQISLAETVCRVSSPRKKRCRRMYAKGKTYCVTTIICTALKSDQSFRVYRKLNLSLKSVFYGIDIVNGFLYKHMQFCS